MAWEAWRLAGGTWLGSLCISFTAGPPGPGASTLCASVFLLTVGGWREGREDDQPPGGSEKHEGASYRLYHHLACDSQQPRSRLPPPVPVAFKILAGLKEPSGGAEGPSPPFVPRPPQPLLKAGELGCPGLGMGTAQPSAWVWHGAVFG